MGSYCIIGLLCYFIGLALLPEVNFMNTDDKRVELSKVARFGVSCLVLAFLSSAFFSDGSVEMATLWAKSDMSAHQKTTDIKPDQLPAGGVSISDSKNAVEPEVVKSEKNEFGLILDNKDLPDRYLIIPKENSENGLATLTDEYLYRTVYIDIKNSNTSFYTPDIIQRYVKDKVFEGKPADLILPPYMTAFLNGGLTKKMVDIYDEFESAGETHQTNGDPLIHFKVSPLESGDIRLSLTFDKLYVPEFLEDNDNYYILLRRPKDVYKKILVVDIGHGGTDPGTYSGDGKAFEKDTTLKFGLLLKEIFDKQDDIKVYYTRTSDITVYRRPRADLANELEADFFLSIHNNNYTIFGTPLHFNEVSGNEVHYNGRKTNGRITSKHFAKLILDGMCSSLNLRKRGLVEGSQFVVLGHTEMPSALMEIGFLTNKKDLSVLQNTKKMKKCAEAVYNAILQAFRENEE